MTARESTPRPTRQTGDSPLEAGQQEARFEAFNRERLRRVVESLPGRQSAFFQLLPLLFHANHPGLPGFVADGTPCGIQGYTPEAAAIAAARQYVRDFVPDMRLRRDHAIRSLFTMGSPGTVAYTRDSDFDLWLVHAPDLDAAAIAALEEKARRLEVHAASLDLEMHFFVFDAARFRRGESLSLSGESSGSSQHCLLLDEFYRSGALLAGLRPMWWVVPPEEDPRYDDFVATHAALAPSHVDFGGLAHIPAGEFFGAAVWQLAKSIESPWKSVLKLFLMESYAAAYPETWQLLSLGHKRALLREGTTPNDLDPYIALYRHVEDYLRTMDDDVRLRLLRRAFYLKTSERLSLPPDPRDPPWRRRLIEWLVQDWGWDANEIRRLDQRAQWRLETALEERRDLVRALQRSYAVLSEFARAHGDHRITERDLTVLGRRLYAAFDRKPGKLEIITRGFCVAPEEHELTLHQRQGEQGMQWLLYVGNAGPEDFASRPPLHRAGALVEMLAWCLLNRLHGPGTNWHCFIHQKRSSATGFRPLLERLQEIFPNREPHPCSIADLGAPPRVMTAQFIVNASNDRLAGAAPELAVTQGDAHDPLQSGSRRVNLVQTIDLVLQTSWEEVFSLHHAGPDAVLAALCDLLARLEPGAPLLAATPGIDCLEPDHAPSLIRRLRRLWQRLVALRTELATGTSAWFVMKLGSHHAAAVLDEQSAVHRSFGGKTDLMRALGEPVAGFRRVAFDPPFAADSPLPGLFAGHKPGDIRVQLLPKREHMEVYLLDGNGSLLHYPHAERDPVLLVNQLRQFLERVQRRMVTPANTPAGEIEFALIQASGQGYSAQPLTAVRPGARTFLPLRLYVDQDERGRTMFNAYLDDAEFSSAEFGAGVFKAVAAAVLAKRASGQRYPVYITDLELSERLLKARVLEPRHLLELLRQKLRIEKQLSDALAAAA